MKIVRLSLIAWGPFRNTTLDFSDPGARVHVVYGRNEAGKSTTLRAIAGLLYGIPRATPDAHTHRMPDLRIGARLASRDGKTIDVVRRKGNTNTLLDARGEPIDEAVLARMMGGVGEELFASAFGLDHDSLRRGAQALLEGKGQLGETLFGAGVGGRAVHDVLASLRAEADALYAPAAKSRPLNEAIRDFSAKQKNVRDMSQAPEAWEDQQNALQALEADRARLDQEAHAVATEQKRLERALAVHPLLAKKKALETRRAELGEVVILPESATRDREEASRALAEATEAKGLFAKKLAELDVRRAALVVPDSLVDAEDAVEDVRARLAGSRKSALELPRARGELGALEEQARGILRRIGRSGDLEEAEPLRVDVATEKRLRALAREDGALAEAGRQSARKLAETSARLAEERARLGALPAVPVDGALERAALRAREEGKLEERVRAARDLAERLAEALATELSALGLWSGSLEELGALSLPSPETIDRFALRMSALVREAERSAAKRKDLALEEAAITKEIDALERGSPVPTEAALGDARERREREWSAVKAAWRAKKRGADEADERERAFEARVREADEIADRLRREAERVSRLAQLHASVKAGERAIAEATGEGAEIAERESALLAEWHAAWKKAGIEPLSPEEMRGWRARQRALVEKAAQLAAARRDEALLAERLSLCSGELASALGEDLLTQSLDALLARASRQLALQEPTLRERVRLEESIARLEKERAAGGREEAEHEQAFGAWKRAWAEGARALGLSEDASVDAVSAVLDEVGALFRALDGAAVARRRVEAMEREATELASLVARLVREHAPDLAPDAPESGEELARRFKAGSAARAERGRVDEALAEVRRRAEEAEALAGRAKGRLDELLCAARVTTVEALAVAEQRSASAREVDRALHALDEQLAVHGDPSALEALLAEVGGTDEAEARLDEIEAVIADVDQRKTALHERKGGILKGLEVLKQSNAAEAATEAQEALAKLRDEVERWTRLRLACAVLTREIERYRERSQGPVLARASALFARLTQDAFTGLRAGFGEGDEPVLTCVRGSGADLGVESLSVGTRDQLYLALRLASLERHAESTDPMPLILDDVLITFDDDRARAALEVLGEFASVTQVLFFTHEAHIVKLAESVLGTRGLAVHPLESVRAEEPAASAL
jgi:uncharacterized protein YhaN